MSTLWDTFKSFMGGQVFSTVDEIQQLLPDSILFGSILLYILTLNIPFGVFSIFLVESKITHHIISWIFNQTTGESRSPESLSCKPGFRNPRFDVSRILSKDAYPSFSIYSIIAIATYLSASMNSFRETMDTMGDEWNSRFAVGISFTLAVSILFILVRYFRGCDTFTTILIATILGFITGALYYNLNTAIFGNEAVNFLGLPFLIDKSAEGAPIYVCSAVKSE